MDSLVVYSKSVSPLTVQIVLILQDPNTASAFSEILSEILSFSAICLLLLIKDTILFKKQNQGPQLKERVKKQGVTEWKSIFRSTTALL